MTALLQSSATGERLDEAPRRDVVHFAALLALGVALGLILWSLAGPPSIPTEAPDLDRVARILTSSEVPQSDVVYIATGLGWLALSYLALAVGLRIATGTAVRLTDGSTWATAVLRLSDFVTLPVIRRIVDGALVATIFMAVWLRARPTVEVGAAQNEVVVVGVRGVALGIGIDDSSFMSALRRIDAPPPNYRVPYSVVDGESLWGIARRVYGDGTQYVAIFRENQGRVMATGEAFTDPRLIRAGWSVDVPLPGFNVWTVSDHLMYRVQPGDSLWRVAESFLGDGFRWTEIWQLNQSRAMSDGRPFNDPNLIFPGWTLELPVGAAADTQPPAVETIPTRPPATPSPTPTPATAPSIGTEQEPLSQPTATSDQPGSHGGGIDLPWPGEKPVVLTAAGLAGVAATFLMVRALANRYGSRRVLLGESSGDRKRPTGDAGRVVLASRSLLSALAEYGFDDVRLALVREAARFQDFFLECVPGDAEALARSRYDLARRLACAIDCEVESPTEVRLRLSRFQRLAGLLVDEGVGLHAPLLVPVGAEDGGVYYLNLAAAGTVMVAGSPQQTRQLLSVWMKTLSATLRADELSVLADSSVQGYLGDIGASEFIPPGDASRERSMEEVVGELEGMIVTREAGVPSMLKTPVLALLGAWGEEKDVTDHVETVFHHGREHGISMIAATDLAALIEGTFGARVVFGGLTNSSAPSATGPGEITLSVGRRPVIGLQAIEVRTEALASAATERFETDLDASAFDRNFDKQPASEELWEERSDEPEELYENSADDVPVEDEGGFDEPGEDDSESGEIALGNVGALEDDEEPTGVSSPMFSIRCFGTFEVRIGDAEVAGWTIHKARELLAYLIAHKGAPVPREEVAEALWPDGLSTQVDHMLSNAAYYLRRTMRSAVSDAGNVQVLLTSGQRYHLQGGLFRVDADAFDAHLRRAENLEGTAALAEYERALSLYRGDFLGREPYEWAGAHRQEYQRRFIAAAHRAAKLAVDCRDMTKAMNFYRTVLDRDPIDEEAARGLMRCYSKLGDTNGVRKVYKVLNEALRRELEDDKAEPLPETKAALEELIRQSVSP